METLNIQCIEQQQVLITLTLTDSNGAPVDLTRYAVYAASVGAVDPYCRRAARLEWAAAINNECSAFIVTAPGHDIARAPWKYTIYIKNRQLGLEWAVVTGRVELTPRACGTDGIAPASYTVACEATPSGLVNVTLDATVGSISGTLEQVKASAAAAAAAAQNAHADLEDAETAATKASQAALAAAADARIASDKATAAEAAATAAPEACAPYVTQVQQAAAAALDASRAATTAAAEAQASADAAAPAQGYATRAEEAKTAAVQASASATTAATTATEQAEAATAQAESARLAATTATTAADNAQAAATTATAQAEAAAASATQADTDARACAVYDQRVSANATSAQAAAEVAAGAESVVREQLDKAVEASIDAADSAQQAAVSSAEAVTTAASAKKIVEDHVLDQFVHLTPNKQAQLDYLIRNYGMVPQTPIPTPSENPGEEGNWEYLSDSVLSAYVSDAKMLKSDGTVPVYACLFPWFQQSETNVWSSTECEPELLPDWCNGTPWLFDCLKSDGTAKQWRPSTAFETGIDDYQGEYLWTWWNVNYIRCNNGNRRITAVEGMDTYKEEGDVDVGVMYAARYCFFDCVELQVGETTRKFELIVIAGAPMTDPRFNADYKARLKSMGVTELKLFKECQRYNGETFEVTPAPYGVHSKYFCVLGGEGTTGCKPRSQKGHMLTNVSHNSMVNGSSVTDGATGKRGVTNFQSKGAGYWGSGMDRNLFLILHLMLKSGSKNTQKYMTGQVNALKGAVACQLGSTVAEAELELVAPGSSVIVAKGAEAGFQVNDFVSVGGNGADFGNTHNARGRIIGLYDHVHPTTDVAYTEIVLELQYGKTTFSYTTSNVIRQQLPPCGVTDAIIGRYDGSPYNLTGGHASPCRVMGTEYGMGAFQICMDVIQEFQDGNLLRIWWASPQTPRQTEQAYIKSSYADLGTYGIKGRFWVADATADIETGTYKQTGPVSGGGSSTAGHCDYVEKNDGTSGMQAYWCYGGVFWIIRSSAGLFGVGASDGGYYGFSYLASASWCAAVCD